MLLKQSKWLSLLAFIIITTILISCLHKSDTSAESDDDPMTFGASFEQGDYITTDSLLMAMKSTEQIDSIQVKGTVESVCKVKGCWMQLAGADQLEEKIFVKFQDYGFFMPLDCEGRELVMQGKAFKEVTSVDELRHYAEDEGLSAEEIAAITEPKEEMKFMATGVRFLN